MRKYIILEFTTEEAELLVGVFTQYVEQHRVLQFKVPAIDFDFNEMDFICSALSILEDAAFLNIDVILYCPRKLNWVLYSLAMIIPSFSTEENDHAAFQCIIKLLHAAKDGE